MYLQCVIGTMRKVFCSVWLKSFLILNLLNLERAVSFWIFSSDNGFLYKFRAKTVSPSYTTPSSVIAPYPAWTGADLSLVFPSLDIRTGSPAHPSAKKSLVMKGWEVGGSHGPCPGAAEAGQTHPSVPWGMVFPTTFGWIEAESLIFQFSCWRTLSSRFLSSWAVLL